MPAVERESDKTLYERLGGYSVIAAIVDDMLGRMRGDPMFQRFSGGRSLDSIQRGRQLIVNQFCALSGGPCVYTGRDMRTSHAGLGITQIEWDAAVGHTAAALDHARIAPKEKAEFIALFERYKAEIVEA